MLAIWVSAAIVCTASLIVGRAFLVLLGRAEWTWLSAPIGFALLVVVAQPLIRLPGRGATAAIVIGVAIVASLVYLRGRWSGEDSLRDALREGLPVALALLLLTALPFLASGRVGVLGEGIYTNDHAAQLFWAEWLQNGFGHEPRGVRFGYPLGPQSLAGALSEGTGTTLEGTFNGLMLAIPALTGLAALAALRELAPARRVLAAVLVGIPYLAASFMAQSAFKETAMALFVVGLAIGLRELGPSGALSLSARRATWAGLAALAGASVFAYSIPGVVWFAAGGGIWALTEAAAGRMSLSPRRAVAALRPAWPAIGVGLLLVAVLAVTEAGAISKFAERLGSVRASEGRLMSPISPREALGVWPQGDFRVNAAWDADAIAASLVALAAAAFAAVWWWRRRDLAIPAVLAGAVVVYGLARWRGGIHVEAKSLAVMSPLLMLFVARAVLDATGRGVRRLAVQLLALVFLTGAVLSTFIALRAAPVGAGDVAGQLDELRSRVAGRKVLFLAADRFSPYRLRGSRVASPGGYVPSKQVAARPEKKWEQGRPIDFDTVPSNDLEAYRFAITTNAAFGSSAPESWRPIRSTPLFTLWKREGRSPPREILDERGDPGRILACDVDRARGSAAGVQPEPVVGRPEQWRPHASFVGTDRSASLRLEVPRGRWQVSMQYHSPVPLLLTAPGIELELPASLDGMYAFAPGQGPVWPVGRIDVERSRPITFTARQRRLSAMQRFLRVERASWLGLVALTPVPSTEDVGTGPPLPPGPPPGDREIPVAEVCGEYVDWYNEG